VPASPPPPLPVSGVGSRQQNGQPSKQSVHNQRGALGGMLPSETAIGGVDRPPEGAPRGYQKNDTPTSCGTR